jgi:SUF system FeS assembly protein, NifU family
MSDIYYEIILEHYKFPRNYGKTDNPDIRVKDSNPLCGDEIEFYIKLDSEKKKIEEIKFIGKGCAISQAAASILTEIVKGKSLDEIKELKKEHILREMGNPYLGPSRIKCATLSLKALKLGVYTYLGQKLSSEESIL